VGQEEDTVGQGGDTEAQGGDTEALMVTIPAVLHTGLF
jgi:hypothetical protein